MTNFSYKAYAENGDTVSGIISAPTRKSALSEIHELGLIPFKISENQKQSRIAFHFPYTPGKLNSRQRARLTRELATLISSGLTIDQTLAMLSDGNKGPGTLLAARNKLAGGSTFADALASDQIGFKPYEISLLQAGENAGSVEAVLNDLADMQEKQLEISAQLTSNMIYPMVLIFMAMACFVVIGAVLAPNLIPLFDGTGTEPPSVLLVTVAINSFVATNWAIVLGALLVTYLGVKNFLPKTAIENLVLKIPGLGAITRQYETARMARVLATQLSNGVTLLKALENVQGVCRLESFRRGLGEVSKQVSQGVSLAEAFQNVSILPEVSVRLMMIGEEANQLVKMLNHIAVQNDNEVNLYSERLLGLMTPVLTILIGLFVGGMIMSVMGAIMSVNDLAL